MLDPAIIRFQVVECEEAHVSCPCRLPRLSDHHLSETPHSLGSTSHTGGDGHLRARFPCKSGECWCVNFAWPGPGKKARVGGQIRVWLLHTTAGPVPSRPRMAKLSQQHTYVHLAWACFSMTLTLGRGEGRSEQENHRVAPPKGFSRARPCGCVLSAAAASSSLFFAGATASQRNNTLCQPCLCVSLPGLQSKRHSRARTKAGTADGPSLVPRKRSRMQPSGLLLPLASLKTTHAANG